MYVMIMLTVSCNKTIARYCQHFCRKSKRSVGGETFWKSHPRRWTDSVWMLNPSSAWLSTKSVGSCQDERKRWLVLHVALPRLETQTWWYFWHVAAFPRFFFSGILHVLHPARLFLQRFKNWQKTYQAESLRHREMDWHIYPLLN